MEGHYAENCIFYCYTDFFAQAGERTRDLLVNFHLLSHFTTKLQRFSIIVTLVVVILSVSFLILMLTVIIRSVIMLSIVFVKCQ